MVPVIASFMPPTHVQFYVPPLFKLWEAFNSSVIDDRLIALAGQLSEEHVSGVAGLAGEDGGAKWKDVGIWSGDEWTMLMGKSLGSMSLSFSIAKCFRCASDSSYTRCSGWSCQGEQITYIYTAVYNKSSCRALVRQLATQIQVETDTP